MFAGAWLAVPTPGAADDATIDVAMHYTQEQAKPLLECFARYEKANEGVKVEYRQLSYRDYLQTVLTSRLGGQSPDIYHLYSIWGAQLVDNGVLAEPPDDVADFVRDGYAANTVEAATIDDTLWGVPTEVSAYLLVSNKKLLKAAGHDAPPTTFDDFLKVAKDVTTRNAQGRIDTAGFAIADSSTGTGIVHPYYTELFSRGIAPYEEDFEGTNFASEGSIEAVDQMKRLFDEDITDRTVDGFDFPAGNIGMIIMANWFEADLRSGFGDDFDETVEVSKLPFGDDWKTMQYTFFMGVDSNSDVADESWALTRWVNSPESASSDGGPSCMGELLSGIGALTANEADLAALGEPGAFRKPYVDAISGDRAITQPNVMQAAEIEKLMANAIGDAWAGTVPTAEAMGRLDEEVSDILSEFY